MRAGRVLLFVAVALALQTSLARLVLRDSTAIDLVLVAVVYVALTSGPVTGLLAGTLAGLAQDALSSGIIGIGGLAKTVVGFWCGVVGTHLIVARAVTRFVVFVLATVVHAIVFVGLYELLELRDFMSPYTLILGQALGNAVVGTVVFQITEFGPGAAARRRAGRGLQGRIG